MANACPSDDASGAANHQGGLWIGAFALLLAWTNSVAADLSESERLFRTGQYADCVQATARTLKKNDRQEDLWIIKVRAEMTLGRYEDAETSLVAGLRRVPQSIRLRWLARDVCRFNDDAEMIPRYDAEIASLLRRNAWRFTDVANQLVIGRWLLTQGADPKKVLSEVFDAAQKQHPDSIDVWLATGELALTKHDYKLAGDAYQKALKLDSENVDALFGVASSFAPSDNEKAEASLQQLLKINGNYVPALLLLVDEQIDSERYDEADKTIIRIEAVNANLPLAFAYKAVLAHLRNQPEAEKQFHEKALDPWSGNPEVDHLIGRKLSEKYRFAEGAAYQRRSLELDATYVKAKGQLAQDLLRLGKEDEGLQLAEEVYRDDSYNVLAHNLVALQERLAKFRTLESDGFIVRMETREAEVYGQRVLKLLQQAKEKLGKKYSVKLDQPVIVEIFPRTQDFAIRTFGLPGASGFLGVCFGPVITATSPVARSDNQSCWEATLWHEYCHTITLTKTKNKMPRWLSEGISVYEERQESPTWGMSITPRFREMILGEDLAPISRLSGAFMNPKTPIHLQFAYYESALAVEYLVQKYGFKTLLQILVDLGAGMPINETLARQSGSLENLDADFAKFARERANSMAPAADWTDPKFPPTAKPADIAAYLKEHPNNYAALGRQARVQIAAKKWSDAKATLEKMRTLYPSDSESGSPYEQLARVYRETQDPQSEREMLDKLTKLAADKRAACDRLCELASTANDWPAVKEYVDRSLAVQPLLPATYRHAGVAAEKLGDLPLAADSYRALLSLEAFDATDTHYRLAAILYQQGSNSDAKRHVLLALEDAPRYRDAQKLLLDIVDGKKPPPIPSPALSTKPAEKEKKSSQSEKKPAEKEKKAPEKEKKPAEKVTSQ